MESEESNSSCSEQVLSERRHIFLDSTVCVLSFWGLSNVTDMISLGGEGGEERERELWQN